MTNDVGTRNFTLTWTLEAPPAQVFRAWTDPEHLDWFYNDQQPIPSEPIELDLRVGGIWRQRMVIDADTAYFTGGIYREIVPDARLAFAWGATDGWPKLDPDRLDDGPQVTVTFDGSNGRTELTLHVELPESLREDDVPAWWSMAADGWRDTIDRLADRLARTPSVI